jgi:hypothetical protein
MQKWFRFCGLIMLFTVVLIQSGYSQQVKWKRTESDQKPLELFHSTHVINLPTAEVVATGDFEFEVSHRFTQPLNSGYDNFYGFDGPANIRLALGYGFSNDLFVILGRSNRDDNLDLQVKYKTIEVKNESLPLLITLLGGIAWNTQVVDRDKGDSRNFQYFVQIVGNTLIGNVGLGLVPSYLYNSALYTDEIKHTLTLGTYAQYYFSPYWSFMIEWNPTWIGWRDSYNSLAFGLEIETGGHFFKLYLTNNTATNISQYLAGAASKFSDKNLHLGFLISRLL